MMLDTKGFIKTGPDLSPENLSAARWPLARPSYLFETSLQGVFAVGTSEAAVLSVLLRQSAKALLQYRLFIKYSKNR